MTLSELTTKLAVQNNRVTVGVGLLTPNIDVLLHSVYFGASVVVTQAAASVEQDCVIITGKAKFLNCDELEATMHAWVDKNGNAQLTVAYCLLGALVSAGDWKFSRSFPDLPQLSGKPYLDRLQLREARFITASTACPAGDTLPELVPGINFVGKVKPDVMLGALARFCNPDKLLDIQGAVVLIDPARSVSPLLPRQYPWDIAAAGRYCPGVFLTVPLAISPRIGTLGLDIFGLNIYSPLTKEWAAQNDSYGSFFTYLGKLEAESLQMKADFFADYDPDGTEITLPMFFSGLSLSNLAALADFSGSEGLFSGLPAELQKLPLGKLALTEVILWLSISDKKLRLLSVSLTVGMPQLRWQVWPEHFCLEHIFLRFAVDDPFGKSRCEVFVYGQITLAKTRLNVAASGADGFTLYVQLADELAIPLGSLLGSYLPQLSAPADLTVQELSAAIAPGTYYQLNLRMANEPKPWVLDLGCGKLTIRDVALYGAYMNGGATGHVSGSLQFGSIATLDVLYSVPGNITMRARFPKVSLCEIISTLCDEPFAFPGGFDLCFLDSSVLIEKQGAAYHLLFGTKLKGFGVLALEVRKTAAGKWGGAVGLSLETGRASALPSMGALALFETIFALDSLLFVAASFADTQFNFPDMARFQNPQIAGGRLELPGGGGVIAGVNFYGRWRINTADQKQSLLRSMLGLDPSIGVTLQIGVNPAKDMRLYVDYRTTIAGHPLVCKFGGQLVDGSVGLFLEGSLDVEIQGHVQTFVVMLDFVTNGAYLSATNKSSVPIDYGVFQLGNLAVEAGFSWQGIPSFGVAGTISGGAFHSSIAVFFDSAQPAKSLVAGAVSDLSLKDVFDSFISLFAQSNLTSSLSDIYGFLDLFAVCGTHEFTVEPSLAEDLDSLSLARVSQAFASQKITIPSSIDSVFLTVAEPGKTWFLTDLSNKMRHYQLKRMTVGGTEKIKASIEAQFYCAPQQTQIGALPVFQQGFYINACLKFFGYKAFATVEIDSSKGFSFEAQMDKIILGNKTLFCVSAAQGEGGPVVSASTYGEPHLYINGKVSILGLSTSVFINANKNGLVFDVKQTFLSVVKLNAHGTIGGASTLSFGGSIDVNIGEIDLGKLGKLKINTGVQGALEIAVSADKISATVDAGFCFAGKSYKLAKLSLDVNTASLAELPHLLWCKVRDSLTQILKDAGTWALSVAKGFIECVGDMISILVDFFNIAFQEACKIVIWAFEQAQKVCSATTALLSM